MKIRKGDKVKVIAGKDRVRGHTGNVVRVLPERNRVIVEGAGIAKRHQAPRRQNEQAGIIEKNMPIHVSNVMILCDKCGPTRLGAGTDEDGRKYRVCRKCGSEL